MGSALALLLLSPGCTSLDNHRDDLEIRHHTWWNYYQRGREHLRQENYALAQQDFETALGIRKGARQAYKHERWRVRTYGMHMMESYFPHRELGISLYHQNRPAAALPLLETSIKMEPTARAKFYINQVKRDLAIAAALPPRLNVRQASTWTAARQTSIEGMATGTNAIAALMINGAPEFIEMAKPVIRFSRKVDLVEGTNRITIAATDLSGKTTTSNLTIFADFTPPEIHLTRQGNALYITCRDNFALKTITQNGKQERLNTNRHILRIDPAKHEILDLHLEDRAGNTVSWSINKKELDHLASQSIPSPPNLEIAQAGQTITIFSPEYELDIFANDDTALKSLQLNGQDLLTRTTPLFRTSRRIPLSIGSNPLIVVAQDNEGNISREKIMVIRRQPEFLDSHYRLSALQFPITGEITSHSDRIDTLLSAELSAIPPRFFMLATSQEENRIKDERNLSASEWSDPDALLKTGNQLNAELVLRIRSLDDAPGRTIYTQVFDVESSKELFTEDIYYEAPEQLAASIAGMVMKIEQRFPLVKARLSRLERELTINAGSEYGLYEGARFLVVQSNGDFDEGRVLMNSEHPTQLVVSGVEPDRSVVILDDKRMEGSIRDGDFVYSR